MLSTQQTPDAAFATETPDAALADPWYSRLRVLRDGIDDGMLHPTNVQATYAKDVASTTGAFFQFLFKSPKYACNALVYRMLQTSGMRGAMFAYAVYKIEASALKDDAEYMGHLYDLMSYLEFDVHELVSRDSRILTTAVVDYNNQVVALLCDKLLPHDIHEIGRRGQDLALVVAVRCDNVYAVEVLLREETMGDYNRAEMTREAVKEAIMSGSMCVTQFLLTTHREHCGQVHNLGTEMHEDLQTLLCLAISSQSLAMFAYVYECGESVSVDQSPTPKVTQQSAVLRAAQLIVARVQRAGFQTLAVEDRSKWLYYLMTHQPTRFTTVLCDITLEASTDASCFRLLHWAKYNTTQRERVRYDHDPDDTYPARSTKRKVPASGSGVATLTSKRNRVNVDKNIVCRHPPAPMRSLQGQAEVDDVSMRNFAAEDVEAVSTGLPQRMSMAVIGLIMDYAALTPPPVAMERIMRAEKREKEICNI
jgi:hypothetical protein